MFNIFSCNDAKTNGFLHILIGDFANVAKTNSGDSISGVEAPKCCVLKHLRNCVRATINVNNRQVFLSLLTSHICVLAQTQQSLYARWFSLGDSCSSCDAASAIPVLVLKLLRRFLCCFWCRFDDSYIHLDAASTIPVLILMKDCSFKIVARSPSREVYILGDSCSSCDTPSAMRVLVLNLLRRFLYCFWCWFGDSYGDYENDAPWGGSPGGSWEAGVPD